MILDLFSHAELCTLPLHYSEQKKHGDEKDSFLFSHFLALLIDPVAKWPRMAAYCKAGIQTFSEICCLLSTGSNGKEISKLALNSSTEQSTHKVKTRADSKSSQRSMLISLTQTALWLCLALQTALDFSNSSLC